MILDRAEKLLLWLAGASVVVLVLAETGSLEDWWEPASALATAAAALFAGGQIYYTRKENRRRATFDHIREVTNSLKPLWSYDAVEIQKGLLDFYRRDSSKLPEGSSLYLSFLAAADLLAFAIDQESVDRDVAVEYLQSLFNGDLLTVEFLREFRRAARDEEVYRHLWQLRAAVDAPAATDGD